MAIAAFFLKRSNTGDTFLPLVMQQELNCIASCGLMLYFLLLPCTRIFLLQICNYFLQQENILSATSDHNL